MVGAPRLEQLLAVGEVVDGSVERSDKPLLAPCQLAASCANSASRPAARALRTANTSEARSSSVSWSDQKKPPRYTGASAPAFRLRRSDATFSGMSKSWLRPCCTMPDIFSAVMLRYVRMQLSAAPKLVSTTHGAFITCALFVASDSLAHTGNIGGVGAVGAVLTRQLVGDGALQLVYK